MHEESLCARSFTSALNTFLEQSKDSRREKGAFSRFLSTTQASWVCHEVTSPVKVVGLQTAASDPQLALFLGDPLSPPPQRSHK